MKIYLFVCSVGTNRSPLAAGIAKQMLSQRGINDVETDYTGLGNFDILNEKINSASRIYAIDDKVEGLIKEIREAQGKEIYCMDIPSGFANQPDEMKKRIMASLEKLL